MLPDIGLMVGLYIITKMLVLIKDNNSKLVKVFAVITILVAIIGSLDLFLVGTSGKFAGLK
ncbi:hypothetical protein K9F62_10500 [Desulfovibrio sp. JY]|nr:hypothetical protein K9F62_10500 [Desulfovibrio sp. JY]